MTPEGIIVTVLAIGIFIVAIREYRKRQERGEVSPARPTNYWMQALIVGLAILGLIVLGINNLYGLPTAVSAAYLIFIFGAPLLGFLLVMRLIFAIIHRLER